MSFTSFSNFTRINFLLCWSLFSISLISAHPACGFILYIHALWWLFPFSHHDLSRSLGLIQSSGTMQYPALICYLLFNMLRYPAFFAETRIAAIWNCSQLTDSTTPESGFKIKKFFFWTVPKMWSPKTVLPLYLRILFQQKGYLGGLLKCWHFGRVWRIPVEKAGSIFF